MEAKQQGETQLTGARILVVEDEWMVASVLQDYLKGYGCEVVGPANRVAKGKKLAAEEHIDGALLDLNIDGEVVYPVAQTLKDRGIPYAFLTGYAASWISESFRVLPALQKPVHADKLRQLLEKMLKERKH